MKDVMYSKSECTVLLKKDGTFPISKPEKIALFGEGVRHTIKGGTGSGDVNVKYSTTVERAFIEAGFKIVSTKWLEDYDKILAEARENFIKEIKLRAKKNHTLAVFEGMGAVMKAPEHKLPLEGEAELAIYVLARNSGEGNDRKLEKGDILLSTTEVRDILRLNNKYKKFMLVLNVGGPVDLSPVKNVKNILLLSQLGSDTGNVLADIILGKANPSGKLATTWAFKNDLNTIGEFGEKVETRYKEGIYVGYRYYDSVGIKNDFPFGYGLSYSEFEISNLDFEYTARKVKVSAKVKNTGSFSGKEVVQVYVSAPAGKLDKPYQSLVNFEKTKELMPDEEEILESKFALQDIASYDEESSSYILEKGDYVIRIGNSSVNTNVCGVLKISENITILQARKTIGKPDFEDWKPENVRAYDIPADAKTIEVNPADFEVKSVEYNKEDTIDEFIENLTDEELAYTGIGHFNPKAGMLSVIGNASSKVAGAAGETTGILEEKGFEALVMADGPAGLRLTPKYAKHEGKIYPLGDTLPADIGEFLPKIAVKLMGAFNKKPPKEAEICEQYATAIPIGSAIAQSFNKELAFYYGDIVGSEMEKFGVDLWLAPALNIHRDLRCGRNFEYYSEDPVVSGKIAASITKGVQSHSGKAVTIKHYAANNQETCRYTNNSQVSERAMREIYLKGFGICVKEANPLAVMTSYNLLNGVHTSEREDLSLDILRCEYGFEGIIMTDWVVAMMADKNSPYGVAHSSKVAKAGGDLFMPGCKADYKELLSAIKKDETLKHQVKINASRVYRLAKKLKSM